MKKLATVLFCGILYIVVQSFTVGEAEDDFDEQYVNQFIGSFIDEMNDYSDSYSWDNRYYIQDDILHHRGDTKVDCDLPGCNIAKIKAADYLLRLKTGGLKLKYSTDFDLIECRTEYGVFSGVFLDKEIIGPDGTIHYTDFIQLYRSDREEEIKIMAIVSNKYQSFEGFKCLEKGEQKRTYTAPVDEDQCILFDQAEAAYNSKDYARALHFYKKSEVCASNISYVKKRIEELSSAEKRKRIIEEADLAFEAGNYDKAMSLYETYLEAGSHSDIADRKVVQAKIKAAQEELDFINYIERGDEYFSRKFYEKALLFYNKALQIKPQNTYARAKAQKAENLKNGKFTLQAKSEIRRAKKWVEDGDEGKFGDALIIFMKYENSGFLEASHYFYMAQLLDAVYKKEAKKEFNISNHECCVRVRRYAIKSRQMGLQNKSTEYFWDGHLNEKSRTCK